VIEAGSFFGRVPGGADVHLMVRVLHRWSDADWQRIPILPRGDGKQRTSPHQ
jgi:hypothetical protein